MPNKKPAYTARKRTTAKTPDQLGKARAEISQLRLAIATLENRNADLLGQIARHGESRMMSPGEQESITEQAKQFGEMNAEFVAIGLFLRNNYAEQINAGLHEGRKLSSIIVGYLGELKALKGARGGVQ